MRKFLKRITAIIVSVILIGSFSISAFGTYNKTFSDSYQKFYYSGGETTTNNYTAYSQGKNVTSKKRRMVVIARIFSKTGSIAANNSSGKTAAGIYRECYAIGSTNQIYYAYHASTIYKGTSASSGQASQYIKYKYYN